jgi:hypothetical protein
VHLADPEPVGDLTLCELVVEAEAQDLRLPLGERVEQLVDQDPELDPPTGRLAAALQPVGQRAGLVVPGPARRASRLAAR